MILWWLFLPEGRRALIVKILNCKADKFNVSYHDMHCVKSVRPYSESFWSVCSKFGLTTEIYSVNFQIDISRDQWCNLFPCIKTRRRAIKQHNWFRRSDFVNKEKSLEISHKLIESTMYYENGVLERPKLLITDGKGK